VLAVKALLLGLFCCLALAQPALARIEATPSESRRDSRWVLPLHGPLGSPFGPRWGRMHEGIDIEGWAETRVRAARTGTVTRVGWLDSYSGYGLVIKIRHDGGRIVTMYAHLAKALVKPGDVVGAGQLIAKAGCTGSCSGVHLHFSVWENGKLVDPLKFLGRKAFDRR
jgi:murein DD-endopeptidase MepM/ murein hydrolase activator NlpD